MEKMMVLKGVSPVMSRQFPDSQSGATVTIFWVELTMTDGIDTIVGELRLPKVRNAQGEYDDPKAPGFDTDRIYAVAFEIDGASGTTDDGKYWSRNRVNIRKIVAP